jgi:hypothetical protein
MEGSFSTGQSLQWAVVPVEEEEEEVYCLCFMGVTRHWLYACWTQTSQEIRASDALIKAPVLKLQNVNE